MDGKTRMLRDIENEVEATQTWIGKRRLDSRVMAAIAAVPREQFVPDEFADCAYHNGPLAIGYGQTVSQPYIVALMTDLLAPAPGDVVLEIGTGSGYQAAVLSRLVKEVYSLEIIPELAEAAARRLRNLGYLNVTVRAADGYEGWAEHAPYDGIIVTAAAGHVPEPLLAQLRPGGRLVIPVGPPHANQSLELITKATDGAVARRGILPVVFVPFTGRWGRPQTNPSPE